MSMPSCSCSFNEDQILIPIAFYLRLDMGSGGAQQLQYNGSAFRKSRNNRNPQRTLYISHVIEPHSCSNPAYGKIQVGIYIAAIQETIDRARQDMEASENRARGPPADIPPKSEGSNTDADRDLDKHSLEGPTRSNKRINEGNMKCHASGMVIDDEVCIFSRFQAIVVHDSLHRNL